jgi:hypothetical protein
MMLVVSDIAYAQRFSIIKNICFAISALKVKFYQVERPAFL